MTANAETQTLISAAQSSADTAPINGSEEKWPVPYAAMFMAGISALLWYGIITAGSALMGAV